MDDAVIKVRVGGDFLPIDGSALAGTAGRP
jgi:hypothetical protein